MALIITNVPRTDAESRPSRRNVIVDVNDLNPETAKGNSGTSGTSGRSGYSGFGGQNGQSGFSGLRGAYGWSGFSGLSASKPSNSLVVSQSGGDFTSIQSAINSITTASSSNPYVILIYPGVYNETLTCKDFVHLQGFGSVEYSTSSVVVQGTNSVVTTANCNITGIRFNLQTGGSGTLKLINGGGTGTTFRCTFNNCYFVVTGNYGANQTKFCENNGTSDIFFTHSSLYFRPTSSVGCVCFDSVTGTNNLVDFYMNHFVPSGPALTFWRKQTSSAIDEIHLLYFRENTNDANLVMFRNESTQNINANGIFSFESTAFNGTYVQTTSSGLVLLNNGDILRQVVKPSSNYTVLDTDNNVLVNCLGSTVIVTLPSAANRMGRGSTIKDWKGNSSVNNITIVTTGGETIDGLSSVNISSNYGSISVVSDGTNWSII